MPYLKYYPIKNVFISGQGIIFYGWDNGFFNWKSSLMIANFLRMVTIPAIWKNNSNHESRKKIKNWSFNIRNHVQLFVSSSLQTTKTNTFKAIWRTYNTCIQEAKVLKNKQSSSHPPACSSQIILQKANHLWSSILTICADK